MQYLISDLHLGHREIIDVYDRPFESVKDMNQTLIDNWNRAVGENDKVLFLGDLGGPGAGTNDIWRWWGQLNSFKQIIRGNHEPFPHPDIANTQLPLVERAEFEYRGLKFECTHKPSALTTNYDGWGVYGHVHNNKLDTHPFIDPDSRRINVSAELLHYYPIPMDELYGYIVQGKLYRHRPKPDN